MVYRLTGRIDSNNAAQLEEELTMHLADESSGTLELNASELSYISSAGLRVLLRVRKTCPDMRIINVNSEVYDILDMTGFTKMMTVEKSYRVVSIEGCEVIGRGAKGTIYRIDQDNVVKVYNDADALDDIRHEREMAKLALILGIPTAISYDVVKVGNGYGSVFELLNARSFSQILAQESEKMDWCVKEYVAILKKIHNTLVPSGKLPDIKVDMIARARFLEDELPENAWKKLLSLINSVPHDDHMIHGDYHTKNVMLQNDEVLIIDMDTLSVGNPIFELSRIFNAFCGFTELDHSVIKEFQGFDYETGQAFWHRFLAGYLDTQSEAELREAEDKSSLLGYTYLICRTIRNHGRETEAGRTEIAYRKQRLLELLERTDSLVFPFR